MVNHARESPDRLPETEDVKTRGRESCGNSSPAQLRDRNLTPLRLLNNTSLE
jgi:hypothetical protein